MQQSDLRRLPFLAASPAEESTAAAARSQEEPGSAAAVAAAAEPAASLPARALMALSSAVAAAAAAAVGSSSSSSKYETTYREFPLPLDKLRCLRGRRKKASEAGKEEEGGGGAEEERRRRLSSRRPVVLVACGSFNPPTIAHLRMFRVAEEALRRGKREEGDEGEGGEEVLGGFLSPTADAYAATPAASRAKAASLSRSTAEDRCALCRAAAGADPRAPLAVDEWEAGVGKLRGAPVRTLRVLQAVEARLAVALREAEGGACPDPLPAPRAVLLCGEDLLASMADPSWDAAQVGEIAREYGIVCVLREPPSPPSPSPSSSSPPRSHPRATALLSPGGALAHLAGHVTLVEDPADLRGVSSTLAREELRREEEGLATGDGGGGGGGGGVTGGSWLVPPAVAEEARRRGMYR